MAGNSSMERLTCVFDSSQIAARVRELARDIDNVYGNEPLVAVCILKGAFIFFGDLIRSLKNPNLELDFVRLSSYGMNSESSRHITFGKDVDTDISGRHVLIVEDIVDSGHTIRFLLDQFAARKPLSLRIAAFVDKRERRETGINIDFAGFFLNEGFLVGYGMDYGERYRALPALYKVEL